MCGAASLAQARHSFHSCPFCLQGAKMGWLFQVGCSRLANRWPARAIELNRQRARGTVPCCGCAVPDRSDPPAGCATAFYCGAARRRKVGNADKHPHVRAGAPQTGSGGMVVVVMGATLSRERWWGARNPSYKDAWSCLILLLGKNT